MNDSSHQTLRWRVNFFKVHMESFYIVVMMPMCLFLVKFSTIKKTELFWLPAMFLDGRSFDASRGLCLANIHV